MTDSTSYGLLSRMRADSGIPWEDFQRRYHDLLTLYGRLAGLFAHEQEELVNDVLFELFHHDKRSLFRYDKEKGRFRNYLRTIANRKVSELRRRRPSERTLDPEATLSVTPDPTQMEREESAEREKIILAEAAQELKLRFHPQHVQIFLAYVFKGKQAAALAEEFGVSLSNVYTIKSRMQKEFRAICAELDDLI